MKKKPAVKSLSPWLCDWNQFHSNSKAPPVFGKVSGMTLQGMGTSGILFFKKEVVATFFLLELKSGPIFWTVSHSFDEFRKFYDTLMSDSRLGPNLKKINVSFVCLLFGNSAICMRISLFFACYY